MISRAVLVVVVVGLLVVALLYSQRRPEAVTVSGFIEADEIRLGSRVGGRVRDVRVEEGVRVDGGDLLVELEPFDLQDRRAQAEAALSEQLARLELLRAGYREEEVAQAEARLEQARAELLRLENGPRPQEIAAAQADVNLAAAEVTLAEENLERISALAKTGSATREALDFSEKELKTSQSRLESRRKQLDLLEEGTRTEEVAAARARVAEAKAAHELLKSGYRPQEIEQAYAAMRAAESARDVIDRQLQELQVTAPSTGVVDAIELQPGDLVAANAPVISLIDTSSLWVRAYVPENRLGLQLGQKLPVTVDSFPGEVFEGQIGFIARQAEFTPSNVQTPEERSKQVFRIKVHLDDPSGRLRPGMAADVWLEGRP
jgi:multidrug resistance efflux pump